MDEAEADEDNEEEQIIFIKKEPGIDEEGGDNVSLADFHNAGMDNDVRDPDGVDQVYEDGAGAPHQLLVTARQLLPLQEGFDIREASADLIRKYLRGKEPADDGALLCNLPYGSSTNKPISKGDFSRQLFNRFQREGVMVRDA